MSVLRAYAGGQCSWRKILNMKPDKNDINPVEESGKKAPKKRGHAARNAAIIVLCVFALLVGAAYFAVSHFYSKLNFVSASERLDEQVTGADVVAVPPTERVTPKELDEETGRNYSGKSVTNILLVGVDNDYLPGMDSRGNADGLIIASINNDTKQLVLSSIMRDTKVTIPNSYSTKITLVYNYCGIQTLIETIEDNFKIPIDGYVMVNYLDVMDVVDAVGGVDLNLTESEIFYMSGKIENLCELAGVPYSENMLTVDKAGQVHLNGLQTAAYLRVRLAGNGDYERTERARNVLMQIKDKALDMGITELLSFADTALPKISTDISKNTLLSMAMNISSIAKYETVSLRIPADGMFYESQDGNAMIVPDLQSNAEYLHSAVYGGALGKK